MRSFTAIPLLLCVYLATCEAQSTVPPRLAHQLQQIANLPPGTPILVRERYAPYPSPCTLAWIDNNSIACDTPDGRIIYPATSLASVAPDTPPSRVPVGLIVATSAGAILGGLIGSNGSAGSTAAGVFLGAGFVGGVTAAFGSSGPSYPPPGGLRIPLRAHPFSRLPMRP